MRAAQVVCRSLLLARGSLGGLWATADSAVAVGERKLLGDGLIDGGLLV